MSTNRLIEAITNRQRVASTHGLSSWEATLWNDALESAKVAILAELAVIQKPDAWFLDDDVISAAVSAYDNTMSRWKDTDEEGRMRWNPETAAAFRDALADAMEGRQ